MAEPGVAPGGSPRVGVRLGNWPLPPATPRSRPACTGSLSSTHPGHSQHTTREQPQPGRPIMREGQRSPGPPGHLAPHLYHHLKGEDAREDVVQVLESLEPQEACQPAPAVAPKPPQRADRTRPSPLQPGAALTLFLGESVRTGSSAARAMLLRAMTTRMTISK